MPPTLLPPYISPLCKTLFFFICPLCAWCALKTQEKELNKLSVTLSQQGTPANLTAVDSCTLWSLWKWNSWQTCKRGRCAGPAWQACPVQRREDLYQHPHSYTTMRTEQTRSCCSDSGLDKTCPNAVISHKRTLPIAGRLSSSFQAVTEQNMIIKAWKIRI